MSRSALLFLLLVFFAGSPLVAQTNSQNQENSGFQPPHRVKANFNAHHPGHSESVKWKEVEQGYQATFSRNNQEVVSEFDQNGQWIKSQTAVSEKDLPSDARQYIKENYQSYEYKGGNRHETKKNTSYKININSQNQNHQLEFDKNGGIIEDTGSE